MNTIQTATWSYFTRAVETGSGRGRVSVGVASRRLEPTAGTVEPVELDEIDTPEITLF
jgi:hypothetical protein